MNNLTLNKSKYLLILVLGLVFISLTLFATFTFLKRAENTNAISHLIAYWNFDEIEGWEAIDTSGNGLHAYTGTALPNVVGKKDYSLLFDGIRSYAAVNDNSILDFGIDDSFSISVWIKMNDDIKDWRAIVGKASQNSSDGYVLRHNKNGNIAMMVDEVDGENQSNAVARQNYRDGNWHYVVGVINRFNDTNAIYIDGYKKDESDISDIGSLVNDYNLGIGSLQNGSVSFDGLIDEVRMYDRALTNEEIAELYNQDCDCDGIVIETPAPPVTTYPIGSLLQAYNDNKIYYITKNNMKKWIVNAQVFELYNNDWNDVIRVNAQDLNQYETVNLIRGISDHKVYLIDGIRKVWIETQEDFERFGFKTSDIDVVRNEELLHYHD